MKKTKGKFKAKRILAMFTAVTMLAALFSAGTVASAAVPGVAYKADAATADSWQNIFPQDSTENAGGVWTDKSVVFGDNTIRGEKAEGEDNFLVGLSAMGSKLTLTTETVTPVLAATDTVFVLDDSNSMSPNQQKNGSNPRLTLATAVNEAMDKLMQLNPDNRAAVVFYGSKAEVLLPLGHYTNADGKYIEWDEEYYKENDSGNHNGTQYNVADGVTDSSGKTVTGSINPVGATNQQAGMLQALTIFERADENAKKNNIPVMVIMTDGAATYADDDYTNRYTEGSGSSESPEWVFYTQLTASYVKQYMKNVYKNDFKTYTMGMYAENEYLKGLLVDPAKYKEYTNNNNVSEVLEYWKKFEAAAPGNVTVRESSGGWNGQSAITVQKYAEYDLSMDNYVDAAFEATDASGLVDAFTKIYEKIQNTSTSGSITRVTDDGSDYSGYVTFLDHIGAHMAVEKVRGIMLRKNGSTEDVLYDGHDIAVCLGNSEEDAEDVLGDKYDKTTWTQAGNDLVASIRTRLKLGDVAGPNDESDEAEAARERARALIGNAYDTKQLSYTDENTFSNYFGWYSDENYNCIAPWDDTTDPDGEKLDEAMEKEYEGTNGDIKYKDMGYPGSPEHAAYLNKSYLYYDKGTGSNNTLYISVRVSRYIGEEKDGKKPGDMFIAFAVPASLLPIVDYEVKDISENPVFKYDTAAAPITLLYELKPGIDKNTRPFFDLEPGDAKLNTNNWNNFTQLTDKKVNLGSVGNNTYSYFEPAVKDEENKTEYNSKYYFDEDTPIYTKTGGGETAADYAKDDNFAPYTGEEATWRIYQTSGETENDSNAYYYKLTYYEKVDGEPVEKIKYLKINDHTLCGNFTDTVTEAEYAAKKDSGDGHWYIPEGAMKRHMSDYAAKKASNVTGTFEYSNMPFISDPPGAVGQAVDLGNLVYACAVLGNNGLATVEDDETIGGVILSKAESGIKAEDAEKVFTFTLKSDNQGAEKAYLYNIIDNGEAAEYVSEIEFTGGEAKVELKAGESRYIGGLKLGEIAIAEQADDAYKVKAVKVDGEQNGREVTGLEITHGKVHKVEFENMVKSMVNVTINYLDDADRSTKIADSFIDSIDAGAAYDYENKVPAEITYPETNGKKYIKVETDGTLKRDAVELDSEEDIVINVYYSVDELNDGEDKETGGDDIPDKYQAVVKFVSADSNGTVTGSGTTQVFTLVDELGEWAESGDIEPSLGNVTAAPKQGYAFDIWTKDNGSIAVNPAQKITVEAGSVTVFKAHFEKDDLDDEHDSEEGGDGIPDKYQAVVKFDAKANGRVSGAGKTQVFTAEKSGDEYANTIEVEPSLDNVTATPNNGYKFDKWTKNSGTASVTPTDKITVNVGSTTTFWANFKALAKIGLTINYLEEGTDKSLQAVYTEYNLTEGEQYDYSDERYAPSEISTAEHHYTWVETDGELEFVAGTEDVVVNIYYTLDDLDDANDKLTDGDDIPDEYQAVVKFIARDGGAVSGKLTQVFTLEDENGNPSETGSVTAENVNATANPSWEFIKWTVSVNGGKEEETADPFAEMENVNGGDVITYYANFAKKAPINIIVRYIDEAYKEADDGADIDDYKLIDSYTEASDQDIAYDVTEKILDKVTGIYGIYAGKHYIKSEIDDVELTGITGGSDIVINVYYTLDELNDGDDETEGGDNIPDKYQAVVKFESGDSNGTVTGSGTTQVFTLVDELGEWAESGDIEPSLGNVAWAPNEGYAFDIWTKNGGSDAVDPEETITVDAGSITVFRAYFGTDVLDDEDDNTTDGDGILDKYQAVVEFKANSNGAVTGSKLIQVFTLVDEFGEPSNTGKVTPKLKDGDEVYAEPVPDEGYAFVCWTKGNAAPVIPDEIDTIVPVDPEEEITGVAGNSRITFWANFDVDSTDGEDPTGGDEIPDRYQAVVTFVSEDEARGTVSGNTTQKFTLKNGLGNYVKMANIEPSLDFDSDEDDIKTTPKNGYAFSHWTFERAGAETANPAEFTEGKYLIANALSTESYVFVAHFKATGGGGGLSYGTIEIEKTVVAPEAANAANKEFEFIIYSGKPEESRKYKTVTVKGDSSKKVSVPAGTYYVVENGGELSGYNLNTECDIADNKVRINKNATAKISFKNTYTYKADMLDKENHFGYIVGYPGGNVKPNANITRAEAATIFFRMMTDEARAQYRKTSNSFSDVSESSWYNIAISTLANAHILNGYSDGTFRPNASITRAELSKIAASFYEAKPDESVRFSDIDGHWAEEFIKSAYGYGFIDGYPDGSFKPDRAITRAETMKIVNRSLDRVPHKDHMLDNMIKWPDNANVNEWYYADVQEATNSHNYTKNADYEVWTEILPMRNWAALEVVK